MTVDAPPLPDGIVAFVKADCPTCVVVNPVLAELARAGVLVAVYTQDDPAFPDLTVTVDDTDLDRSYAHDIEVVPTLLHIVDGTETDRLEGWSRDLWTAFTGVEGLALRAGIPDYRPGCGSLSVDPDRVPELQVRHGDGLRSRRVELATAEDEFEAMFDRGWSDGLPLVPPTPERVLRMLAGTSRAPDDPVAIVPPNLVEATVEKVAVNVVMAGCRPDYLPVVLAVVEAVCTDEFNMHGVLATTMPVGPVLIVNGPIRRAMGMNAGVNVLGQGNRANSTIGRAVQLIVRNIGGGRPGGVDRAAHGSPAKVGFCFPEDEEASPWTSHAADLGYGPDRSTVTVFAGSAPEVFADERSRDAEGLAASLALRLCAYAHPKAALAFDAFVVIGPEHAARFRDAGWDKARTIERILDDTERPIADLVQGAGGIATGLSLTLAAAHPLDATVPKFRRDGGLTLLHAGGGAGLFSAIIGGWASGPRGSQPTTREITP